MADVKITFQIDGIKKEVSSVEELQQELKAANKEAKDYANSANDAASSTKELGKESKKTEKETGFLKERFDGIKETFSKLKTDAKGVAQGFMQFSQGLGLSAKASKGLAVGLSALGIPLLLAGIAALVDYFKNFEGAALLVQKALNVVGAVVRQLTDAFIAFIKFDFSGVADAIRGIGNAATEAANQTDELFTSTKALHDLQKENVITNANLRQEIERQKRTLEDNTLSLDERLEALNKVNAATEQLQKNEIAETEAVLRNLQAQLELEKNYEKRRELEQQIADTQAELINKETELNGIRQDAAKVERELIEQQTQEREQAAQKALDIRRKYYEQLTSLEQKNELARIQDADERAQRRLEIERENSIAQIEQAEFSEEQKRKLIAEINDSYDLQEQARIEEQAEKQKELETKAGEQLMALENEIALMRQENDNERYLLQLEQQEERDLKAAEDLENAEAMKEAIREKYRLLRQENEMTMQEKINEILGRGEDDDEELDEFEQAQLELERQEELQMRELESLNASEQEKQQLRNKFAKERKALAEEQADFEILMQQKVNEANLQLASQAFAAVSQLVGENTAASKAAAVASATIDTYLAAQKAYTSQLIPGDPTSPIRATIAAGVAVATGIANVAKIVSTPTPGPQTGGGGGGRPSRPNVPQFNPQDAADNRSRGQAAGEEVTLEQNNGADSQPVVKAYVVSSEMTDQQEKDKKITDLAKL